MLKRFNPWQRGKSGIRRFSMRHSTHNRFAAALYYGFFNHQYRREIQAVAAGQAMHGDDATHEEAGLYLLRRNIHRLEKGLLMRPRRPVFATDFIAETVRMFERVVGRAGGRWDSEVVWAEDVLTEYFEQVDRTPPVIATAHAQFQAVEKRLHASGDRTRSVPYQRDLTASPPVDFPAFLDLTRRRRSVRWYLDKPVPRDLIEQALAAAGQSPTACNRQPFVFRIFDEPARTAQIASIPMGTKGFADNLPAVAVVVGQLRAYPYERDRHVIYIDGALAAMSFMLALETMGLSSCPINWPDQEPHETRMHEALGLAPDERVVMLIGFGWPDPAGHVAHSTKRSVDDMRVYG